VTMERAAPTSDRLSLCERVMAYSIGELRGSADTIPAVIALPITRKDPSSLCRYVSYIDTKRKSSRMVVGPSDNHNVPLPLYTERILEGNGVRPAPILLAAIHIGKLHKMSDIMANPTSTALQND
jgi:hypothetical protein